MNSKTHGCAYLAESARSISLASKYFSSLHDEDLDAFLSIHQKAWNALWQSDVVFSGFNVRDNKEISYGLEALLNKGNQAGKLPPGYLNSSTLSFSHFVEGNGAHANLKLFKLLRNQAIHDYFNVDDFREFAIPYLRASFSNYLDRYRAIRLSLISLNLEGVECYRSSAISSHICLMPSLPKVTELEQILAVPVTMGITRFPLPEKALSAEVQSRLPEGRMDDIHDIVKEGEKIQRLSIEDGSRFFMAMSHTEIASDKTSLHSESFRYDVESLVNRMNQDGSFPFLFSSSMICHMVEERYGIHLPNDKPIKRNERINNMMIPSNELVKITKDGLRFSDLMAILLKSKSISRSSSGPTRDGLADFLDTLPSRLDINPLFNL